jgi:hypothetical protein
MAALPGDADKSLLMLALLRRPLMRFGWVHLEELGVAALDFKSKISDLRSTMAGSRLIKHRIDCASPGEPRASKEK